MAENPSEFVTPVSSDGGLSPRLFYSPVSSNGGLTPRANAKPQLNESLMELQRPVGFIPPDGMLQGTNRPTVGSRQWGDPPFFVNAKPARMLEQGWIRSFDIRPGMRGLVTIDDGPSINVTVKSTHPIGTRVKYVMIDNDRNEEFVLSSKSRYYEWDFYVQTAPVPFVPRGGSKKTRRSKKKSRKMRRKA